MRRLNGLFAGALAGALMFVQTSAAQEQRPIPVEIWGCNFVNGSDMDDLRAANDDLNEWADDNGITNFFSSMLTPIFHSPENDYDVYYLDAWASGAAMGEGYAKMSTGSFGPIAEGFDQVVDCPTHAVYGGLQVVPWSEDRGDAPVQFQDCTVRENLTNQDAIESIQSTFSGGEGPGLGGFALLFPFAGQGLQADFSFKRVAVFNSYEAMGTSFDVVFTPGFQQANSGLNDVMVCDTPRTYTQVTVREMQPQD
jgi:hypothetical protein